MSNALHVEAAASLLAQRQTGKLLQLPAELKPRDLDAAYRIQACIEALRPEYARAGGYKVSCMRAESQRRFGVSEPVFSRIGQDRIFADGASIVGSTHYSIGFECEIGARLRVSATGQVTISATMATLEIIEQRYAEVSAASFPTMVADSLYGAGCVLGVAREDWGTLDLCDAAARVLVDGVETVCRPVSDSIGDPRRSIAALLAHGRDDRPLQDGMVVLTGSLCGEIWVKPGQRVTAEIEGLGSVGAHAA